MLEMLLMKYLNQLKGKTIIVVVLLLLSKSAYSQFDGQMSQYMFNLASFNPAAAGEGDLVQVIGQFRMQWIGIPNAGKPLVFGLNSPLKIGSGIHGVGVKFVKDDVGLFTNNSGGLQYAYKMKLGNGKLSIGTNIGYLSVGFKGDSVKSHGITIGDYHKITGDNAIPQTMVSGSALDLNLGALYSTPLYYLGASYSHLNSPKVAWGDKYSFSVRGTAYFVGGYNYTLLDPKFVLKPSMLVKTDFSSLQFDLSTRIEYDSKYWGGLSYRLQDAVVILAGMNLSNGLSVGCSYDLPTSQIITVSPGSFELVMMYSFEYLFGKSTSKYKSIRLL